MSASFLSAVQPSTEQSDARPSSPASLCLDNE
ncbi:mannosyl (alpha-1,3-)-glycoprotein beta-1,4-N-acetylglucosaminyltransferase, isozyme C (predicted), isoform CRA_b, partial [Rattus norvegicus]